MGIRRPPLAILRKASDSGRWDQWRLVHAVADLPLSVITAAWDNDELTVEVYEECLRIAANLELALEEVDILENIVN